MSKRLEVLLSALEKSDNISYNKKDNFIEREAKIDFIKRVEQLFILKYFLDLRPLIKKLVQTNYLNLQNIESLIWENFNIADDGLVDDKYTWIYREDLEHLIKKLVQTNYLNLQNIESLIWENFNIADDGLVDDKYTWIYREDLEHLINDCISKTVADIENQTLKLWE